MSDTNNGTNVPNPVKTTLAEFRADPVKWVKKGNKLVYGNVLDTKTDPLLNIRTKAGSTFHGVTAEVDTLDLPSMRLQLMEGGGINEPLLISVRTNGDLIRVRGNRRGGAAELICDDPNSPPDLVKALKENTPMILMTGLTPQQEMELVEDQTQKPFMRHEVVRHIFALRKAGWGFERIADLYWETIARWTGKAKKAAEVRAITDMNLKREKVRTWLRGSLDCYLLWGYDLGEWMRTQMILSEMQIDGVTNSVKPYFDTTKKSQPRVAALKAAKIADGGKFSPLMLIDGSEFKKVADSFRAEDYGEKVVTPRAAVKKMLDRTTVIGLRDTYQSHAVRAALGVVLGEEVADMQSRDDFATIQETKMTVVEQFLPRLKPEVAAIVRACMVMADPTDFQMVLEANCVKDEIPAAPEVFSLGDAVATDDGNPTDPAE